MKNIFLLLFVTILITSCGGKEQRNGAEDESADQNDAAEEQVVELDGQDLIVNSDCQACHQFEATVVGPSYKAIAEKYEPNDTTITYLAGKVIEGGAGNWGTTPMTPHPQHSQEEAEAMVRYILSLE